MPLIPYPTNSLDDNDLNIFRSVVEIINKQDSQQLYTRSYNLFDKNQAGDGSISSSNGTVQDNGFKNTGFILVKPSTVYTGKPSVGAGAFYDSNRQFISGTSSSNNPFTTPSNCAYYRGTLSISQVEGFMLYEGTEDKPYVPYGIIPSPPLIDPALRRQIEEANEYFNTLDSLTVNRGKNFPIKSVKLGSQEPVEIAQRVKDVVLSASVSGALTDMYYRLTFVANGHVQGGQPRYGISVEERRKSTGFRTRFIFTYNDGNTPENQQNYNVEKGSDGIDTIIVDNGEIVISVTVDRAAITASSNPLWLNLNSGAAESPTAVIEPSTYTAF